MLGDLSIRPWQEATIYVKSNLRYITMGDSVVNMSHVGARNDRLPKWWFDLMSAWNSGRSEKIRRECIAYDIKIGNCKQVLKDRYKMHMLGSIWQSDWERNMYISRGFDRR